MDVLASIVLLTFCAISVLGDGPFVNRNLHSGAFAVSTKGFLLKSSAVENQENAWEFENAVESKKFLFGKNDNKETYITYGLQCYKSLLVEGYNLARLFYLNNGREETLMEIYMQGCYDPQFSVAVQYTDNHHKVSVVTRHSCVTYKFMSEIPESEECDKPFIGDFNIWEKSGPYQGGEESYEHEFPESIVASVRAVYSTSNDITSKKDTWKEEKARQSKSFPTVIDGKENNVKYGLQCYKNLKEQGKFLARVSLHHSTTEATLVEATVKECGNVEKFIGVYPPTEYTDSDNYHRVPVLFKHTCITYKLTEEDTHVGDCAAVETDWSSVWEEIH